MELLCLILFMMWIEDMEVPKECYDQFYCGSDGRFEDCPIHELPDSDIPNNK